MNLIKQRIAICKACGWKHDVFGYATLPGWPEEIFSDVVEDLNAMNQAEKSLNEAQLTGYQQNLAKFFKYRSGYKWSAGFKEAITATAAQRAEAFLRTLNLWTD